MKPFSRSKRPRPSRSTPWGLIGLSLIGLYGFATMATADTMVSGLITNTTTWTVADSPYEVIDDIIIATNGYLIIEPGVEARFRSKVSIDVMGRLHAVGTESQRIIMTGTWYGAVWDGFNFYDSREDNEVGYIDMMGANWGSAVLWVENSKLLLHHAAWSNSLRSILYCTNSHVTVEHSIFPGTVPGEVVHGGYLEPGDQFLFRSNLFEKINAGYSDVMDLSGFRRPGPILEVYDCTFLGSEDGGLDLDNVDAHIEGCTFTGFFASTNNPGTSNPLETDQAAHIVFVRNLCISNEYAFQAKGRALIEAENNTFVMQHQAAVNFNGPAYNGGSVMEGNIFWANSNVFFSDIQNADTARVDRSLLPAEFHAYGSGNIDADPLFTDFPNDLHLQAGSPAIGTGPNGLDMGWHVPAGATVTGEPGSTGYQSCATLIVDGPGIWWYKYRINNGSYSPETEIDVPIVLTNLTNGIYTVYVLGKNSAGRWQEESKVSISRTWQVVTADRDCNGMADTWEVLNFGDTNQPGAGPMDDTDLDRFINLYEYIAGTDPNSNSSDLALSIMRSNGWPVIGFQTLMPQPGQGYPPGILRKYSLERTVKISPPTWSPIPDWTGLTGNGSWLNHTNQATNAIHFFRVKTWLE